MEDRKRRTTTLTTLAALVAVPLGLSLTAVPARAAETCDGKVAKIVVLPRPGSFGTDPVTGTPGEDVIVGSVQGDDIDGAGGNDTICGLAGADDLAAGPGDDRLFGGLVRGRRSRRRDPRERQPGGACPRPRRRRDVLDGGRGRDVLDGSAGLDRCLRGERLRSCERRR